MEEYNSLPIRIKQIFDNPSCFKDIKYYAVAEDYDPDMHSLIGNTTSDKDKVSFIKGDDGKDKVISI